MRPSIQMCVGKASENLIQQLTKLIAAWRTMDVKMGSTDMKIHVVCRAGKFNMHAMMKDLRIMEMMQRQRMQGH